MKAARPGDLVTSRVTMARLYKFPGPADENSGNPITGIAGYKEVALVIATTQSPGQKEGDPPFWEALVLCGESLGWRDFDTFDWLEGPLD